MTHTSNIFPWFDVSNVRDGRRLLQRYETWFKRYPQCAQKSLGQRLVSEKNAMGAWFELLVHELLFQLGCEVDVADIDNTEKTPDLLASHSDRNCYVEVTPINPSDNPALSLDNRNLQDALGKLNTLNSSDFQIRLIVEGRISRTLSRGELTAKFGKLLSDNDPRTVRSRIEKFGKESAPYVEIGEENWSLRGELVPIHPQKRGDGNCRELIVEPVGGFWGDASFEAQEAVSKKAKKYRQLDAPFIVALNVLDVRFDREAEAAALFGQEQIRYFPDRPDIPDQLIRKPDGVWLQGGPKPRYTRLAAVIMFNGLCPRDPRGSVCLYINPFSNNMNLPEPLYRLPHAIGEDGRLNWVDGIDIETLLAI